MLHFLWESNRKVTGIFEKVKIQGHSNATDCKEKNNPGRGS